MEDEEDDDNLSNVGGDLQ